MRVAFEHVQLDSETRSLEREGQRQIARATLDGMGVDEDFIALPGSILDDFDVADGYIYWADGNNRIGRANPDGSGVDPAFIDAHVPLAVSVVVPEPATGALVMLGLIAIGALRTAGCQGDSDID